MYQVSLYIKKHECLSEPFNQFSKDEIIEQLKKQKVIFEYGDNRSIKSPLLKDVNLDNGTAKSTFDLKDVYLSLSAHYDMKTLKLSFLEIYFFNCYDKSEYIPLTQYIQGN